MLRKNASGSVVELPKDHYLSHYHNQSDVCPLRRGRRTAGVTAAASAAAARVEVRVAPFC